MKNLFAALVKAQSEMGGAVKDSNNPFFKSKYADLSSVMEAIRPAFTANGLGFVQVCHDAEHAACVETIIIHASGESYSCGKVSVPVSKPDAQGYGSAITYAKRYSLQAAVGVPSVDDDGNAAAKAVPVAKPKADAPPDLLAKASAAAADGLDAYKGFWSALSAADRSAIGDSRHADFKAIAKDAIGGQT